MSLLNEALNTHGYTDIIIFSKMSGSFPEITIVNTYYVQSIVVSASYVFTYLILTITIQSGNYYNFFIDKKSEMQKSQITCLKKLV